MNMYDRIEEDLKDFNVCNEHGLRVIDFADKHGTPSFPAWAVAKILRRLEGEKENLKQRLITSYRLIGIMIFVIVCCIFSLFYTSV